MSVYSQVYQFGYSGMKVFADDHPAKSKLMQQFRKPCFASKSLKLFTALHSDKSNLQLRGACLSLAGDTIVAATTAAVKTLKYSVGRQKESKVEKVSSTPTKTVEMNKLISRLV